MLTKPLASSACVIALLLGASACTGAGTTAEPTASSLAASSPAASSRSAEEQDPASPSLTAEEWARAGRSTSPYRASGTGEWRIPTLVDRGPSTAAAGTVTFAADDRPASYIVAPGDLTELVAKRFSIDPSYLAALNQVRRGYTRTLYAGDLLNLDPATVCTVGDINGSILEEPAPEWAPC